MYKFEIGGPVHCVVRSLKSIPWLFVFSLSHTSAFKFVMYAPNCVCKPGAVQWVDLWFGDCVYSSVELVGFIVGLSSMFFWMIAQFPQFLSNILRQSADALSPWFLFQWLAGDSLNLLGCLLTGDQLSTELMTAYYFIFSDCLIISQYLYYQVKNKDRMYSTEDSVHKPSVGYHTAIIIDTDVRKSREIREGKRVERENVERAERDEGIEEEKIHQKHFRRQLRRVVMEYGLEYGPPSFSKLSAQQALRVSKFSVKKQYRGRRELKKALVCVGGLVALGLTEAADNTSTTTTTTTKVNVRLGRKLLELCSSPARVLWMKKLGNYFGWISSGLYLGSRLSQLRRNEQRKSAEGLSLGMVICAVLANLSYGIAILLRLNSWDDFIRKAPWLVGSLGTVSLDITIFLQAQYLNSKQRRKVIDEHSPLLS